MKKFPIAMLLLFIVAEVFVNNIYSSASIPENLKKNADAVIRKDHQRFELNSLKDGVLKVHQVITILNPSKNFLAAFDEHYGTFREVADFEGVLYDAFGRLVKKVKKKDLSDINPTGENLIADNRKKQYDFYHRSYPYTVEYIYTIKYRQSFYFPTWVPMVSEKVAVEDSRFEFAIPEHYHYRYKVFNFYGQPE